MGPRDRCASGRGLRRVMRGFDEGVVHVDRHEKLVSIFVTTLSVEKRLELYFNWFQREKWEQFLEPVHESRT